MDSIMSCIITYLFNYLTDSKTFKILYCQWGSYYYLIEHLDLLLIIVFIVLSFSSLRVSDWEKQVSLKLYFLCGNVFEMYFTIKSLIRMLK